MKLKIEDLQQIHRASSNNSHDMNISDAMGCFACSALIKKEDFAKYNLSCIQELTDDEQFTMVCPVCHIDAVLTSHALETMGYELTIELLNAMRKEFFY